jgi:hypothetical protein
MKVEGRFMFRTALLLELPALVADLGYLLSLAGD